jgi:hypothetical protein
LSREVSESGAGSEEVPGESDGAASDADDVSSEGSRDVEGVGEASLLLEPLSFVRPADHEKYAEVVQAQSNAMQQQERESNPDHNFGDADNDASRLYDVELRDLVGVDVGFRGRNPYSDHANSSTRYFKMYGRNSARDYVAKATYNGLLWLLVLAGERDVRNPHGSLDASEHLAAWLQAHEEGILPDRDKVPSKALIAAAIEQGVADWSDIDTQTVMSDGEEVTFEGLPKVHYNRIVDVFGDAYGEHPGRYSNWTGEDLAFDELQKAVDVDELDKESSPEVFAEVFLRRTESADETVKDEYDHPRLPVDRVYKAYVYWCEEINGIEALNQYNEAGKSRIAEALGVKKGKASYPGYGDSGGDSSRTMCYHNVNFTGAGYELDREIVPDSYRV